jgi:hypothetical protein
MMIAKDVAQKCRTTEEVNLLHLLRVYRHLPEHSATPQLHLLVIPVRGHGPHNQHWIQFRKALIVQTDVVEKKKARSNDLSAFLVHPHHLVDHLEAIATPHVTAVVRMDNQPF